MKTTILTILAVCFCAGAVPAQKGRSLYGDTWTGVVVEADYGKGELTLRSADEKKPGTFSGVFDKTVSVWHRDGSLHRSGPVEIPAGERVLVRYRVKEEQAGGRKLKVNRIHSLAFLGPDDFPILRSRLGLPDSARVTRSEGKPLPAADPLKLYVSIDHRPLREDFDLWLRRWQGERAAKYGAVELAPELSRADAALVIHNGTRPGAIDFADLILLESRPRDLKLDTVTALLVVPGGGVVEVVWQEHFIINPDQPPSGNGRILQNLEKRLRSRRR
ncbi:MAG TPA: hypothetical protein VG148_18960 [Pyrinomonadaceae bacterium]|nr:hypothetical protein [Pyrinomonadaceae bacterium]